MSVSKEEGHNYHIALINQKKTSPNSHLSKSPSDITPPISNS